MLDISINATQAQFDEWFTQRIRQTLRDETMLLPMDDTVSSKICNWFSWHAGLERSGGFLIGKDDGTYRFTLGNFVEMACPAWVATIAQLTVREYLARLESHDLSAPPTP